MSVGNQFGMEEEGDVNYSLWTVILSIAGVAIAGFLLSLVYGPCEHYSPLIYLNMLLALLFGYGVGEAGRYMLQRYKVRSRGAALVVGLAGGLFAVFCAWVSYTWVISDYEFVVFSDMFLEPQIALDVIAYLAENPLWTIGSVSRKGMESSSPLFYYAAWLAEAGIILYLSVRGCLDFVTKNMLCAECKEWMQESGKTVRLGFSGNDREMVQSSLAAGDMSVLTRLEHLGEEGDETEWLEVKSYACPHCSHRDKYIRVEAVTITQNKKKEPERAGQLWLDFSRVNAETEKQIFEFRLPDSADGVESESE